MPDSTHTLDDLIQELGTTTDEELRAYFHGVDDLEPVAMGKRVASVRIVTDAPHIIGQALVFLNAATDEQLQLLAGVTSDTLRLALGATTRTNELYAARNEALKMSRNKRGEQAAISEQGLGAALSRRKILHGVLDRIACRAEPYASRVNAANSRSESPLDVCNALDGLIDVGHQIMKDKNPGIVARRKTTRLNTAWLGSAADVSRELREAGQRAAAVRTAPEVTQSDVDLHDGWALMLLDEILRGFDDAHQADPTIPRLSVYSLRNVLRPPSGKKTKKEMEGDAPTDHG